MKSLALFLACSTWVFSNPSAANDAYPQGSIEFKITCEFALGVLNKASPSFREGIRSQENSELRDFHFRIEVPNEPSLESLFERLKSRRGSVTNLLLVPNIHGGIALNFRTKSLRDIIAIDSMPEVLSMEVVSPNDQQADIVGFWSADLRSAAAKATARFIYKVLTAREDEYLRADFFLRPPIQMNLAAFEAHIRAELLRNNVKFLSINQDGDYLKITVLGLAPFLALEATDPTIEKIDLAANASVLAKRSLRTFTDISTLVAEPATKDAVMRLKEIPGVQVHGEFLWLNKLVFSGDPASLMEARRILSPSLNLRSGFVPATFVDQLRTKLAREIRSQIPVAEVAGITLGTPTLKFSGPAGWLIETKDELSAKLIRTYLRRRNNGRIGFMGLAAWVRVRPNLPVQP